MNNLYIFDCFGVVVSDVSSLWLNPRCTPEQISYLRKEVFRKVDCGIISLNQAHQIIADICGVSLKEVRSGWKEVTYVLTDTVQILAELKARGGTVVLLSNADESYLLNLFQRFDLTKYFDKIFVSSRYGCAKPDKEFYQICVDSFSQKFNKIYFTDDNPNNLNNLQDLGITPVLFTDAAHLRQDLGLK